MVPLEEAEGKGRGFQWMCVTRPQSKLFGMHTSSSQKDAHTVSKLASFSLNLMLSLLESTVVERSPPNTYQDEADADFHPIP